MTKPPRAAAGEAARIYSPPAASCSKMASLVPHTLALVCHPATPGWWVHARLRLALSPVIEDGALSYWALRHPPGRPDFHHQDAFTLEIAMPGTAAADGRTAGARR